MQTSATKRDLDRTIQHIINRIEYYRLEYGNKNATLSCIYTSLNEIFGKIVVAYSEIIRKKIIELLYHVHEEIYTLNDVVYHLLQYIRRLQQITNF
ncbi:MAG: hypothetical protein K2O85_00655 [Helicobacter sp.]|nr:hypothetical protein [Helicobacter sp.]